jgi:hypothetical protein
MADETDSAAPFSDEGGVSGALERALTATAMRLPDGAAVALARRYACDIDDAPSLALDAGVLLEDLAAIPQVDRALVDRLRRTLARIEQTTVLALLGPKLGLILTELGMTPRARADVKGGGGGASSPQGDELARIRAERRAATPR